MGPHFPRLPIETLLNHLIDGAPWARKHLLPFSRRIASVHLPPVVLTLQVSANGDFHQAAEAAEPDVIVRLANEFSIPALIRGTDWLSSIHVEGNAEFATALSFVLKNLKWDFEEDLSRLVGDVLAHRVITLGHRFSASLQESAHRFGTNLAEYLMYELPLLVVRNDFIHHRSEIERLLMRLDQVEMRSQALSTANID